MVFDTSKRLAIIDGAGANYIVWSKSTTDISALTNCTNTNYTSCGTDGKSNTQKIVAALGESSDYAAGLCYTLTHGGLPEGSWFLPSISELKTLYSNRTKVNSGITTAGGTSVYSSGAYLSSTENSSTHSLVLGLGIGNVYSYEKSDSAPNYYFKCAVAY